MKQLTSTALTHPTMIHKIRRGMYYASKGMGHLMNGHGKRVYIENSKGRNIMRLDWVGGAQGYIVYGNESVNITRTVKKALASVVGRQLVNPQVTPSFTQDGKVEHPKTNVLNRQRVAVVAKVAGMSALGLLLTGCAFIQGMI
jgi:hypothetical protein